MKVPFADQIESVAEALYEEQHGGMGALFWNEIEECAEHEGDTHNRESYRTLAISAARRFGFVTDQDVAGDPTRWVWRLPLWRDERYKDDASTWAELKKALVQEGWQSLGSLGWRLMIKNAEELEGERLALQRANETYPDAGERYEVYRMEHGSNGDVLIIVLASTNMFGPRFRMFTYAPARRLLKETTPARTGTTFIP